MPAGPASSALLAEVRDKVRKAGVVLWIDSEGHYTRFVDAFEKAPSDFAYPVVGLRGSFLELMLELEHYCNGLQPEHLLVHLPALNKETVKETPIYELYKAGTVFEKNLATLVREREPGRRRRGARRERGRPPRIRAHLPEGGERSSSTIWRRGWDSAMPGASTGSARASSARPTSQRWSRAG